VWSSSGREQARARGGRWWGGESHTFAGAAATIGAATLRTATARATARAAAAGAATAGAATTGAAATAAVILADGLNDIANDSAGIAAAGRRRRTVAAAAAVAQLIDELRGREQHRRGELTEWTSGGRGTPKGGLSAQRNGRRRRNS
jgi:hypothetical protein